jgi:molecular chaperone GrpE
MTDDTSPPAGDGAEPTAPDDVGDAAAEFVDQPDADEVTADAVAAGGVDAVDAVDAGDAVDAADAFDGSDADDGADDSDDGSDDLEAAADAVEVDLEMLLSEREQYLDAYRRAQADFENYRKQAQKRQDDAVVRSLGSFVDNLLPVSEVEPVLTALYGALSKEGLERIDPKGSTFDPEEAEAVVHEPGEGGEQVVAEVLRPGYRWRGRVLRPAMVKVTD